MIVWVVKVERRKCLHEHFKDAYEDFKSHDKALIYPKFIFAIDWHNMKDFEGW